MKWRVVRMSSEWNSRVIWIRLQTSQSQIHEERTETQSRIQKSSQNWIRTWVVTVKICEQEVSSKWGDCTPDLRTLTTTHQSERKNNLHPREGKTCHSVQTAGDSKRWKVSSCEAWSEPHTKSTIDEISGEWMGTNCDENTTAPVVAKHNISLLLKPPDVLSPRFHHYDAL